MPGFPIMLDIKGRRCVIVGGGPVALRRAQSLLESGGEVTVIAPDFEPGFSSLPIEQTKRPYRHGDLAGACLVVIASSDRQANESAAQEAREAGVLVNRADDPGAGDFTVPAHAHHGLVTLAVHTGGVSATAAAAIRGELSKALNPDWPRLIGLASTWRPILKDTFPDRDQRRARLKKLCDPQAMAILIEQGEEALLDYYRDLAGTEAVD
jgi:precorrin-2 dehydrogenase